VISDHKHNYSYSIAMHPNRKRRIVWCEEVARPWLESSSRVQILPPKPRPAESRYQMTHLPRSQDIKKQTRFPSVHEYPNSKAGGMVKSGGWMLLVFIGRRPTSVMRKESRGYCEEQHGFGWSNLMEIASVLETIW